MPRRSPDYLAARRAHILAAARRCFARDGFHHTTVPDIAAESGLAVGGLYRYFPGKDDLIRAVAAEGLSQVRGRLDPAPAGAHPAGSAAEIITDLLAAVSAPGVAPDRPEPGTVMTSELARVAVQGWGQAQFDPDLRHQLVTGLAALETGLAQRLVHAEPPLPPTISAGALAMLIVTLLPGLILHQTFEDPLAAHPHAPGIARGQAAAEALSRLLT